ncbi:hypothetical protein E3T55_03335 [Cryobacterium frigoriphilum]|uniref:Uncharacterized protein n=1 Tax=Cryobacterium frigoriphilum TaxID=1259150 RepID=A0A4R9A951_9MICO|nr:hypothetical protein [Cryobacterium frigoriphilum]TFD54476.1 hypothetical protein E3T55_03335 [Cryobacterium frigoriphilum]
MLHLNLGKNRTLKTIALTTAGLTTAGLLAAAVALLPLGAPADESATPDTTLTSENSTTGEAGSAGPSTTPAPESTAPSVDTPTNTAASAAEPTETAPTTTAPTDQAPAETPATETEADAAESGAALTPRQSWLMQQQLVRECMAAEGHDYLYFEWWNPAYDREDHSPAAMPLNLSATDAAAWTFALDGETGGGADYRWQDAGCWGAIVEQLGRTN